jgi:hypothetical protein
MTDHDESDEYDLIGDSVEGLISELLSIAARGEALMDNDLISKCRFLMGIKLLIGRLETFQLTSTLTRISEQVK